MKLSTLVLGLAIAGLGFAASANAATFIVDPQQSYLKIEVLLISPEDPNEIIEVATAQLPGSDTATLSGTLEADITGGNITFGGGSNVVFDEYDNGDTLIEPGIGGVLPGSAPASYGLAVNLLDAVTGPGALRGPLADITGGPEAIAGTSFDSTGLTLTLLAGLLDVNLQGLAAVVESIDITGNSALNSNGGVGYYGPTNGIDQIIIPVNLDVTIEVEVAEGIVLPITARFTGVVATVPEPSSMVLLGMSAAVLPAIAYRRFRRKR